MEGHKVRLRTFIKARTEAEAEELVQDGIDLTNEDIEVESLEVKTITFMWENFYLYQFVVLLEVLDCECSESAVELVKNRIGFIKELTLVSSETV